MDRLKKHLIMLVVLLALISFASFLAAQGPPGPPNHCANLCWQAYLNAVADCHGDGQCMAAARANAVGCLGDCGLLPLR
jgi:hypothetical protein